MRNGSGTPAAGSAQPVLASPVERAGLLLLAGLIAFGAVSWTAGQLTTLLATGRFAQVTAADMAEVVWSLGGNPAAPAEAWPPRSRAVIPGPWTFWSVFVITAAAPLACAVTVLKWRGTETLTGAAWATRRDVRTLHVKKPTKGRLTLGYAGRALLAAEPRQSVIVIGPSQSGKTTGLAIPAILEWDGPVIATSVKSDLLDNTITGRRQRGTVWAYDPTGTAGLTGPSATWTPLQACGTWQGALCVAAWLTDAGREKGLSEGDFWYATAAKLLAPVLFAAATSGRTMGDVVRWVDTQEEREVRFELEAAGVMEAIHAADATWHREERQKSSVYTTAETVLRCFSDPAVMASAEFCDIEADALLDGGAHTLYVCAPSHEQARLRPLFTALLQQMISAAYERSGDGSLLRQPLLIVLDEAANIAPLRDLDTLASTAAGMGIQLVTVWQDLAQIHNRYGDRAATVVNNHRAKIALSGISDPKTLEYFSRLAGESEITRTSTTRDDTGKSSTTQATQYRRLASDEALRQMSRNRGLLVYGHLPPTRLRLRPWFQDPRLRTSAAPPLRFRSFFRV